MGGTAPLGLRGLARGSAASHLKKKGECALRPWGCVFWPEAPLRATSKKQTVRTAPLGLRGLARGSAASHLKKLESAHCAPGTAWSGGARPSSRIWTMNLLCAVISWRVRAGSVTLPAGTFLRSSQ